MTPLRRPLFVGFAFLAACASEKPAGPPAVMFHPAYSIDNGTAARVVNAIDDGRQTAVVFDSADFKATITGPEGEAISFSRLGTYAMFPDTYDHLTVHSNGHVAQLTHLPRIDTHVVQAATTTTSAGASATTVVTTSLPATSGAVEQSNSTSSVMPEVTPATPITAVAAIAAQVRPSTWATIPGLSLRDQVASWIRVENGSDCGPGTHPCYHLAPADAADPDDTLKISVADSYQGSFPEALTWLRDGFWTLPRPEITINSENTIVLRNKQIWSAERGSYLRDVLEAWRSQAGMQPVIYELADPDNDWPIDASVTVVGSFEKAVKTLCDGVHAKHRPVPYLWDNTLLVKEQI